jgi:aldehyde:ferredoxin oxidoreductase
MYGHHGRLLKIDLSSGESRAEDYSPVFARSFLGGNGFAAKLIRDAVPSGADPLGPENGVVFAVGPLTDTPVWGTSRGHVGGISPLTGFFADSNFGDGEGLVALARATARRTGVGDLLALGSERLAKRFGRDAERLLYSVKGLEIAGHSAVGLRPMALGYAVSTRGGSHHDTRPSYPVPDADPGFEGQAEYSVRTQNFTAVGDSLVICRFVQERGFGSPNNESTVRLLNDVTGWDTDLEELERIGERIYNLERLINVERGVTRALDTLPYRAMHEPIPDGPARGRFCSRKDLDAMLDEYYRLRGWDRDGIPAGETLSALGLA